MIDKILKNNREKVDKFVFYFSIVDILFLPYIWFISTNYSLGIVAIWALINIKNITKMREFRISVFLTIFIIISTVISFFCYPSELKTGYTVWISNIKMAMQYMSYFLYYIMFVYVIKKYQDIKIKKILLSFLGFAVILAIIYMVSRTGFANIKTFWNRVDSFTIWYKEGKAIQYRYNFIWTDPNNPAYAFVALMVYLLLNEKVNMLERLYILASTIFLLICSMSTGGALCFFIAIICLVIFDVIPNRAKVKKKINKQNKKKILLLVASLIVILFLVILVLSKTDLYRESTKRIFGNADEGSSSRISIWKKIIKNSNIFHNVIFGTGGTQVIFKDGTMLAPHNGNLYFIYAYGMIFYILFMYEFFRKRKNVKLRNYLFVIPIFIGFTINTIVGEQKFMILYILLYTAVSYKKIKIDED